MTTYNIHLGVGRRLRFLLVLFCAITIILPSFFSSGQEIEEDDLELRVAVQEDILTLNPLIGFNHHWTWMMTQWMYDTPMMMDPETGDFVPYIAVGTNNASVYTKTMAACNIGNFSFLPESCWTNESNPVAIIYYDFTDVLWHDGVQMDIDDVLFSYHVAAQDPVRRGDIECLVDQGDFETGNFTETHWLNIETYWESHDNLKAALAFTLQKPYGAFFHRTLDVLLMPYHLWGSPTFNQSFQDMK